MNGKEILLGLSHINPRYIHEAEQIPSEKRIRRPWKKSLLIAAVISLMLLLLGCAWAILRLQNMTVDTPAYTDYWENERQMISLQGFEGSPSYAAFQEWQSFCDSYDPDQKILDASDDFVAPDAYYSYTCYSQEMVDKIAEICEKYNLDPLGKPWFFTQPEHIFEAVGIPSVFSQTAQEVTGSGYCYGDGTFHVEGNIYLDEPWNCTVGYTVRSVQKTSFDAVYSTVGNLDTYDQWEYTREDGTTVLLALQDEGRILVDQDDCFIAVSAFGMSENPFAPVPNDRAFLEALCECFDFGYHAQRVDPERAYALQCEEEPHDFESLIKKALLYENLFPNLQYALVDINGDGREELLLRSEKALLQYGLDVDENMFMAAVGEKDGAIAYFTGGGAMYLCEGDVIEMLSTFEGEEKHHGYCRFDTDYREEQLDLIHPLDGKLYQDVMGNLIEISEEEAEAIVSKYSRIEIDFKPAAEFKRN